MKIHQEHKYLALLEELAYSTNLRTNRTGKGAYSVFGRSLDFDISEEFPLLTTKKMAWKSIVHELMWFLSGSTNIEYLKKHNVTIWDEWASPDGDVGPMYGYQWRNFGGDQLQRIITKISMDWSSRRLLVSAWNPEELHRMALPPCHVLFQFYVRDKYLDISVYQRSADVFLGLPFNIASYALLNYLVCSVTGKHPGRLIMFLGDAHLYSNHYKQAQLQLSREPYPFPKVHASDQFSIDDFDHERIVLKDYKCHPAIPAEVAV